MDFPCSRDCCPIWSRQIFNTCSTTPCPAFSAAYNNETPNPLFVTAYAIPLEFFNCPSDPTPTQVVGYDGYVYGCNSYMVSTGSGTGVNYDDRLPTDGIFFGNTGVRFRDVTDGLTNTVFMSESVRSTGSDETLPAGTTPPFPFQKTLNGSTGLNSTQQFNGGQPLQGLPVTGSPWTPYTGPNGMLYNPNLSTVWPQLTGWRGATGNALRGRGTTWAFPGQCATQTNGYNPPNSPIPDVVTHFTGFFGPRSWHANGGVCADGRRLRSVPGGRHRREYLPCASQPERRRDDNRGVCELATVSAACGLAPRFFGRFPRTCSRRGEPKGPRGRPLAGRRTYADYFFIPSA